jgi:acetoin:2,6-dichlorophenolindophenol oxidoreductase subunit alpha
VCENNLYAAQTSAASTQALVDVAERAKGYGIPGVVVDGNDIFAVNRAAYQAVLRARQGEGPTLIECKTYRWRAHTERKTQPDPRHKSEVEAWKSKDPIARLRGHLQDRQELTEAGWQALNADVRRTIDAAVAFAEASPFPGVEQATADVFAA